MSAPDDEPKRSRSAAALRGRGGVAGGGGHHQVVDRFDVAAGGGRFENGGCRVRWCGPSGPPTARAGSTVGPRHRTEGEQDSRQRIVAGRGQAGAEAAEGAGQDGERYRAARAGRWSPRPARRLPATAGRAATLDRQDARGPLDHAPGPRRRGSTARRPEADRAMPTAWRRSRMSVPSSAVRSPASSTVTTAPSVSAGHGSGRLIHSGPSGAPGGARPTTPSGSRNQAAGPV